MTIDADTATVFAFFTDPERLIRWMGVSANLDPKPGGLLLIQVVNGFTARGEFTEVVPVSRLAYTFGWEGSRHNVPPGSSLVEIDLLAKNGSTLVRFNHSGLPPCHLRRYRAIRTVGTTIWHDWRWRLAESIRDLIPGRRTRHRPTE